MTSRTTTEEQEPRGLRGVLTMTAVSLALLGGVALWQLRPTGEVVRPVTGATDSRARDDVAPRGRHLEQYPEDQRALTSSAAVGDLAALYRQQATPARPAAPSTTAATAPSIVIVGSQAAAERLQAGLDGGAVVGDWIGSSPLDVQIVVAPTDAAAERVIAAAHDVNRLRAGLGLPESTITDLR